MQLIVLTNRKSSAELPEVEAHKRISSLRRSIFSSKLGNMHL